MIVFRERKTARYENVWLDFLSLFFCIQTSTLQGNRTAHTVEVFMCELISAASQGEKNSVKICTDIHVSSEIVNKLVEFHENTKIAYVVVRERGTARTTVVCVGVPCGANMGERKINKYHTHTLTLREIVSRRRYLNVQVPSNKSTLK